MKRTTSTVIIPGLLAGVLALSGCAGTDDYPAGIASELQSSVLAVTESISASDFAAAATASDDLMSRTDAALERGDITTERHADIVAAATLVRKDIDAGLAEAQRVADEQAAAERAAAEEERLAEEQRNSDDEAAEEQRRAERDEKREDSGGDKEE